MSATAPAEYPHGNESVLEQFLNALSQPGDGLREVRALPSMKRIFAKPGDVATIRRFIDANSGQNLYIGVAARRDDTSGGLQNCSVIRALFVDLDFKNYASEADAQRALDAFLPAPSMVVHSGGGLHPYWLLKEPVDLRRQAVEFKNLLRRTARALGGDLSSAEPARVLRLPGSRNFKYTPPREVQLVTLSPDCPLYDLADFDDLLPLEPEQPEAEPPSSGGNGSYVDADERIRRATAYAKKMDPAIQGQGGDQDTFKDAAHLCRGFDLSDEECFEILDREWNHRCVPTWNKKDLRRKIRNARKYGKEPIGGKLNAPRPVGSNGKSQAQAKHEEIPFPGDDDAGPEAEPKAQSEPQSGGKKEEKQKQSTPNPWPDPKPLPDLLPKAPEMPVELLPVPFQEWLADTCERMQVPLEMAAAPAIVAAGSVIGNAVTIKPKRFDDWTVTANLYGADIAPPGMLKTPAINEAQKPLDVLNARAHLEYESKLAESRADTAFHQARKEALLQDARKAMRNHEEFKVNQLKTELVELESTIERSKIFQRRYFVNDATVEKLHELLRENPRGLLVRRDELTGWLRSLDKIGRETDRAFFLESWNGDRSFDVDRIGRGTTRAAKVTLSIFGSIQPARLAEYVTAACDGAAGDDGLLQRFQIAVYPEPPTSWKNIDRKPNIQARDRAFEVFERLDGLGNGTDEPLTCRFDSAAQDLFDAWHAKLEYRLLSSDHPAWKSHLGKYRSLMPSLALIFHLIENADHSMAAPGPVSLCTAKLAAAWCEFLELHARKVYAGAIRADIQAAHALAAKIKEGKIKDGCQVRDVYRNQWSLLRTKSAVYDGLAILAEHDWGRVEQTPTASGGKPTDTIRLNPKLGAKP